MQGGAGRQGQDTHSVPEGNLPVVARLQVGAGKVAAVGEADVLAVGADAAHGAGALGPAPVALRAGRGGAGRARERSRRVRSGGAQSSHHRGAAARQQCCVYSRGCTPPRGRACRWRCRGGVEGGGGEAVGTSAEVRAPAGVETRHTGPTMRVEALRGRVCGGGGRTGCKRVVTSARGNRAVAGAAVAGGQGSWPRSRACQREQCGRQLAPFMVFKDGGGRPPPRATQSPTRRGCSRTRRHTHKLQAPPHGWPHRSGLNCAGEAGRGAQESRTRAGAGACRPPAFEGLPPAAQGRGTTTGRPRALPSACTAHPALTRRRPPWPGTGLPGP